MISSKAGNFKRAISETAAGREGKSMMGRVKMVLDSQQGMNKHLIQYHRMSANHKLQFNYQDVSFTFHIKACFSLTALIDL